MDMRLNKVPHVECLRREQALHSQWLVRESQAPNALLSWGSSVLRAPALLQGKNVCAGRQPPVSSQLITQLCARLFATLWTVAHQAPLSMEILQARILE